MLKDDSHKVIEKLAQSRDTDPLTIADVTALADVRLLFQGRASFQAVGFFDSQLINEIVEGPDRLRYLVADLPLQSALREETLGARVDSATLASLRDIAASDLCIRNCLGVVIRSQQDRGMAYTPLTPGEIWSLRSFGHLHPADAIVGEMQAFRPGSQKRINLKLLGGDAFIGEPDEQCIPHELRADLSANLTRTLQIEIPKVVVVQSSASGSLPVLIYNYFPEQPLEKSVGYTLLPSLHPPPYNVMIATNREEIEKYMVPLKP